MESYLECGGLAPLIPNLRTSGKFFFQIDAFASLPPRKVSIFPLNRWQGGSQFRLED